MYDHLIHATDPLGTIARVRQHVSCCAGRGFGKAVTGECEGCCRLNHMRMQ